jgi:hypothetical protein
MGRYSLFTPVNLPLEGTSSVSKGGNMEEEDCRRRQSIQDSRLSGERDDLSRCFGDEE